MQTGISPSSINRALNDDARSAKVPEVWAALFDLLNLEVTVRTKTKPVPYEKTESYKKAKEKRAEARRKLAERFEQAKAEE